MKYRSLYIVLSFAVFQSISCPKIFSQSTWQSQIVHYDGSGKLVYVRDGSMNVIPDFSNAGYEGGGVNIPDIPVVKTISAVAGDNTAHLQAAIDSIGLYVSKDLIGIRGTLLLKAGMYEVDGSIYLNYDGIILRGEGEGSNPDSNTVIYGKGDSPHQRSIIIAGGGSDSKWSDQVSGTKSDIISDTVLIGTNYFRVADPQNFKAGDNIIINHPCTDAWLRAINYGGTHSDEPGAEPGVDLPWTVGSQPLVFNRNITKINGDTVYIDVPLFNTLIRSLSQSYLYTYARKGIKTQIGIENLRVDIETAGGTDENHAWQAIDFFQIEDSWVKNVTTLHFGQSGIRTSTANRITIEYCSALDPVSIITGERRYNYQLYTASQQILVYKCRATNGRHSYMSNGSSWTSGDVFLDCTSQGAYAGSEGHRRWSMGLLYDNITELDGPRSGYNPRLLGLYNRGYSGTSHGWAAANSVAWNCNENNGDLIVQKPPTAQNYAIGCFAKHVTGVKPPAPFDEPQGYIEGTNKTGLNPPSLYLAQLDERFGHPVNVNKSGQNPEIENFKLMQNYPNPFNPSTSIEYEIPKAGLVSLIIYDSLGQDVLTLVDKYQNKGKYSVVLGANQTQKLASGIYFYRLTVNNGSIIKKMIFIK